MLSRYIDIERLIHSLKTAIAILIGFAVTKIIALPSDQWIVISIIVVMCAQIYVGSVMQKAYLRFLGTVIGCLLAAITLVTAGHTTLAIGLTLGISGFIFSYLATGQENLAYAGTLGAVTTAIILLGTNPTVLIAAERFLEIAAGILIATLVSQFILPIHASTHLRRAQAATLRQLSDYLTATMATGGTEPQTTDYYELDESIVKTLLKQRQLAKESAREPLGLTFNQEHFIQSLYCEKEILRAITFMHSALANIKDLSVQFTQTPAVIAFNETILQSLKSLIDAIEADNPNKTHIHIPSVHDLKIAVALFQEGRTQEEFINLDGFLFSAGILTENLGKLATLFHVPIYQK